MKLQFKHKEYQSNAVDDVVDCFAGQPKLEGITYHLNPDKSAPKPHRAHWINDHYMPQVLLTKHRIVSARFFNAMAAKEEEPGHPDLDPEVPVYRGGVLAELETAKGPGRGLCPAPAPVGRG